MKSRSRCRKKSGSLLTNKGGKETSDGAECSHKKTPMHEMRQEQKEHEDVWEV